MRKASLGILAISVVFIIGGIGIIVAGIVLLIMRSCLLCISGSFIGLLLTFTGYNLKSGDEDTWRVANIVFMFGLFFSLINLDPIGILANILLLYYLNKPDILMFFGRKNPIWKS